MNQRRPRHHAWSRPLIGLLIATAGLVALYLSYNADKGLPFRSMTVLWVEVPNADELHEGDTVQIGGARVGMVRSIDAEAEGARPYARIELEIVGNPRLPVDSTVSIEPLSILGEKTLVLQRGHSRRVLAPGAVLPLSQARPVVDLNAALSTFNPPTVAGLQGTITAFADAFAGRGNDLNDLLAGLAPLLPALQAVSENLSAPATNLSGFIGAADRFMIALDPVSSVLPAFLADTASTFEAIAAARPSFGALLNELPAAESASTRALAASTPALGYLRTLAVDLRPAGGSLRPAIADLDQALAAGPATLKLAVPLSRPLARVARGLRRSVPPQSAGLADSLNELDVTVRAVSAIDSVVGPAQEMCNVLGTALRNGGDVIGEGDAQGSWFTFLPMLTPFMFPTGSTSSSTHVNDDPIEDARGCVAGNEPYLPGPRIGNPPAADITTAHDVTAPPAAATERARAAGLLTPPPGARLG